MAITSNNVNPKNDTKYARRRAVFKGTRNQLKETVDALKAVTNLKVHEFHGPASGPNSIVSEYGRLMRTNLHVNRVMGTFMNSYKAQGYPAGLMNTPMASQVYSDLKTCYDEFCTVIYRRLVRSDSPSQSAYLNSHNSLLLYAHDVNRFDLIVSKYGYDSSRLGNDPHFYHWQARMKHTKDMFHLDDLFSFGF